MQKRSSPIKVQLSGVGFRTNSKVKFHHAKFAKPGSFFFFKKMNYYNDEGLRVEKIFSKAVTHGTQIPCVEWSPEEKVQCRM